MSAPNQWRTARHTQPKSRVPFLIGILVFALVLAIAAGISARQMAAEAERTVRPQLEDVLR